MKNNNGDLQGELNRSIKRDINSYVRLKEKPSHSSSRVQSNAESPHKRQLSHSQNILIPLDKSSLGNGFSLVTSRTPINKGTKESGLKFHELSSTPTNAKKNSLQSKRLLYQTLTTAQKG